MAVWQGFATRVLAEEHQGSPGHGWHTDTLTRWHLARRLDKAGASGSTVVRQWGRGLGAATGDRLQARGQQQHQMLLPPQPGSTSCQWLESTPSKRRPPYKRSITVCSCVHVCRLSEQACIARTKRDNAPTPAPPHQTQPLVHPTSSTPSEHQSLSPFKTHAHKEGQVDCSRWPPPSLVSAIASQFES